MTKAVDEQTFTISNIPENPLIPLNPLFLYNPELQKMLIGKQILIHELPFSMKEIQEHYENGYISYRKGIEVSYNTMKCERDRKSVV